MLLHLSSHDIMNVNLCIRGIPLHRYELHFYKVLHTLSFQMCSSVHQIIMIKFSKYTQRFFAWFYWIYDFNDYFQIHAPVSFQSGLPQSQSKWNFLNSVGKHFLFLPCDQKVGKRLFILSLKPDIEEPYLTHEYQFEVEFQLCRFFM